MNQNTTKPVSPERAEQIRKALAQARSSSQALFVDRTTGQLRGSAPLSGANPDKVNAIGKFDTHYAERVMEKL